MVQMRTESIQSFISDDNGGGTIMGLFWVTLLAGVFGLAVDSTDGLRDRPTLQATAEASALAGVVHLPNGWDAVRAAVSSSADTMPIESSGHAMTSDDVTVGTWSQAARSFQPGGMLPDAIQVRLRQTVDDLDPVPAAFLRIANLLDWDVDVQAVAQRYVPDCLRDGLIADQRVDISSNNGFVNQVCIHGQDGVALRNDNYFGQGATVSMPDPETMLGVRRGGMTSNPGLPHALRQQSLKSRLVPQVGDYMDDLLTKQTYVLPAYVDPALPIIVKDENWDFADLSPSRVYHVQCAPGGILEVPADRVLVNMVLISDCEISVGSGVTMINVILASRAAGDGSRPLDEATIVFADNVNLGLPDNCTPGGGVQVFSNASVRFSSSMTLNGVQIVAKGDIALGARRNGTNGINAHAGQDIRLTSSNMFGICSGGSPQFFPVWYYRVVG